jgi:hypothetical protein
MRKHHNVAIRVLLVDRYAADDGRVDRNIRSIHQTRNIRV